MVEVISVDSQKLVDAVRIWSGWGQTTAPSRDDSRLKLQLGTADAERLLPVIKKLEEDFYSSDARFIASDLDEMQRLATEHFRQLYPNAAAEIARVFAWCYTFDFK